MLDQVKKTIKQYRMLTPRDRVLVAVSGGVDSVVLLYALRELQKSEKLSLAVAHFDHAIRTDSAADAEFVKKLARSLKLRYYSERADVPAYAKAQKLSLEVLKALLAQRRAHPALSVLRENCESARFQEDRPGAHAQRPS
jgi:tRNA(Ile)-lysidine synthase